MSLSSYANSGAGRNFLRMSTLKGKPEYSIIGKPIFGFSETLKKDMAYIPVTPKGGSEVFLWSPGKNAPRFLIERVGEKEESWSYPIHGYFEVRKVETKQGDKLAWFFVPSGWQKKDPAAGSGSTKTAEKKGLYICGT